MNEHQKQTTFKQFSFIFIYLINKQEAQILIRFKNYYINPSTVLIV